MRNEFIYQIFPQTFYEIGNSGIGNIKGIISKLDYLKDLGITRIWISPVTKSPFKDSGYDVQDYCEIDEKFGDMKDFEVLVLEAKKRNLKIIIDIVFNHTSNKHEWFKRALNNEEKYMNYYIFKDPIDGKEPTNWKSKMGGSCWEYVPKLNKYYLHLFTKEQPDLNWENKELQKKFIEILNFWREKGVDGFRLDVCNLYSKPKVYENDLFGDGRGFYTDGEHIEEYFKMLNINVFSKDKEIFTVGEVSSTTKEKSLRYAKTENEQLDSIFTFLHLKVDYKDNNKWSNMKPDLNSFWELQKEWQTCFQNNNSTLALFMNNHDQPRAISRFGDTINFWYESATSIFAFTSLMRGIPFIYQGEEIGMTNLNFESISDFKDIESIGNAKDLLNTLSEEEVLNILRAKSRDNARSVMQWDNTENSGFSKTKDLKLFLNENYKRINVQSQIKDRNSVLSFYKKVIKLRLTDNLYCDGNINFFKEQEYSYSRTLNNRKAIIITNWNNYDINLNLEIKRNEWKIILNNYDDFNFNLIKPYQVIVLERNIK
ncbi:alpha,alpha-phosphotrehalase [Spiroplasma diminutum]|uniref:Trehalose-6-phosphate hydrolase n=1 Tax=Spiroplasma diminutum CUAS-1 TaxID=1276221 RepID=S5M2C6_9MOLU|nr:alpha,alpha-phosphotrehalase [Spiroplasma diminutum]AGR42217.1 trehalose-6-phosphate hydrolase [Spiroplasma diminutum CUAS-1]